MHEPPEPGDEDLLDLTAIQTLINGGTVYAVLTANPLVLSQGGGRGLTGERLQELLNQEGLDHRPFPIEGLIRESLVILEELTGQQHRFG